MFDYKMLRRTFGFDGVEWEENGENCKEFLDVRTCSITDTVVRSRKIRQKSNFCIECIFLDLFVIFYC